MTAAWRTLLLLALCLGCGREAEWVRLRIADVAADPSVATWQEKGAERSVWLRHDFVRSPWTRYSAHDEAAAAPTAWLLEGPAAAVLLQHAASLHPAFRRSVLPSRLGVLESANAAPRLALVLDATALPSPPRSSRLADLERDDAARLVAAAQALGAWDALQRPRLPLEVSGRPFLPRFVPRAPGDWSDLRGSTLESFLPDAVAAHVVGDPELRASSYAELQRLAAALPELAGEVRELGAALPEALVDDDVRRLPQLLEESAAALTGYLDSIWLEHVVTEHPSGVLEIDLYLHSVVPVRVEGLASAVPQRLALLEKNTIAGVRLVEVESGRRVPALAQRQRILLPVRRDVMPRASGLHRFRSTRLRYRVEGLEDSGALRVQLLENLRPVVTRRDGRPVDPSHARHLAAVSDPRFSAAHEEDPESFAEALPTRLRGGAARFGPDGLSLGAGSYELVDDLLLPQDMGLRLEAGVELRIHPGRSILVRGALHIEGSADEPVRIRGASAAPWGVLAAQGRGGDGMRPRTRIRHLELEGGSEDALRGATYSGQLSVHHQDLLLEHATLRGAHADDSLNVKYGRVEIRDAVFVDNRADAVDLDWVEARVRRSRFEGMGPEGDGLDLSGSRVVVEGSVFSRAEDKCISVGEASQVEIRGALLRDCALGLASKDSSRTRIERSVFLDNRRDLAAYRKKPIFGGGLLEGSRLVLVAGREGALRDPLSRIEVRDSVFVEGADDELDLHGATYRERGDARGLLSPLGQTGEFSVTAFERVWSALR